MRLRIPEKQTETQQNLDFTPPKFTDPEVPGTKIRKPATSKQAYIQAAKDAGLSLNDWMLTHAEPSDVLAVLIDDYDKLTPELKKVSKAMDAEIISKRERNSERLLRRLNCLAELLEDRHLATDIGITSLIPCRDVPDGMDVRRALSQSYWVGFNCSDLWGWVQLVKNDILVDFFHLGDIDDRGHEVWMQMIGRDVISFLGTGETKRTRLVNAFQGEGERALKDQPR